MTFSIVIPIYNEEEAINKLIIDIKKYLPKEEYDYEIIAVNDGSTDQSKQILKQINDIKVIHHSKNQGYGASIKSGIRQANGEYILITDADDTYPVKAIPELLKYAKDYDMVSGNRQGKNLDHRWFYSQRIAKLILKKLANYVTKNKIPDINCGLRIFKKEIAEKFWGLYPEGFSFTITSLIAFLSNDYKVKFIPINYHERSGKSTLKPFRSFTNFINLILKITLFFKPIRVFLPISILILFLALGITVYGFIYKNIFFDTTLTILSATALQIFFFGLLAEIIIYNRK